MKDNKKEDLAVFEKNAFRVHKIAFSLFQPGLNCTSK